MVYIIRMRLFRLALIALALAACQNPAAPPFPAFRWVTAPPSYRTWYTEMEACSGLRGDYELLQFGVADAVIIGSDSTYKGGWLAPHTVVMRAGFELNEHYVKHEFMHDLLQRKATGDSRVDHPLEFFLTGPCGPLL